LAPLTLVAGAISLMDNYQQSAMYYTENHRNTKIALVSSGLGNVERGFEVSCARWFHALKNHTDFDVHLLAGGNYPDAVTVPNIKRNSLLLKKLSELPILPEKMRWELTYGVEQISFLPGLLGELSKINPDVVWVKDVPLAHFIMAAAHLPNYHYKVIFANGGIFNPQNYKCFDHIQQLNFGGYGVALEAGIPGSKMDLIPNCLDAEELWDQCRDTSVRQKYGIAEDDYMIVCCAAWNRYHKRIDYLIEEVAKLNDPKIKLVLCGVEESDTPYLKALGEKLLQDRVIWLTLPVEQVPSVVAAANLFVLPSLDEGLGNVLIEAAIIGTPIICHPHSGAKFIIEDPQWMCDISANGALASRIVQMRENPPSISSIDTLRHRVYEKFSDRHLVQDFSRMIEKTLAPPTRRRAAIH
jgi:glycosyltransferase involved in cell wall biosynthesis